METQEERVYPFITTSVFYFLAYYMIRRIPVSDVFQLFLLGAAICSATGLLINFYSKVSIHMIGTGGLLGAIIGLSLRLNAGLIPLIVLIILISGFTGFARLKLNAHTQEQVYAGFLTGLIIMLTVFLS
jgi:membrane-associated phospholipid phosphatase